jgi:ABC-type polar amino acid transport system ATPase subunit
MTAVATETERRSVSGAEIRLENVTKRYPNTTAAAVDDFSMVIPAGKIVVFVGPSGCGKTTTMRMINRMVEPTSGVITIDGRDALHIDADELRRGIGYAIQQAGLFPHFTVAQNIAVVPGLLRWDQKKINARVEEMMELVGLDPATFRDRLPRQLSGGQQQRVGVARALAADPPVLLMDDRSARSTRSPAATCRTSCCGCRTSWARRSCSSPTTSTRRSSSATGSPCWGTARPSSSTTRPTRSWPTRPTTPWPGSSGRVPRSSS